MAASLNHLLKRFPKSAYVLQYLTAVYAKKGDVEKAKEYENKLKEATQYADKGLYLIKK
jgi:predicted Zn-dependent protease